MPGITRAQAPFARRKEEAAGCWGSKKLEGAALLDVVTVAKPTVLIGVSGQANAFTEAVVREMARHTERPVIFPLSNPTSRSEAVPEKLLDWTDGRALIGTGSPFPPVVWNGREHRINQTNNSYIFPGVGLGVIAAGARRVSEGMFMAAAKALAAISPAIGNPEGRLLPDVGRLRSVSFAVAVAVARQAQAEGLAASRDDVALTQRISSQIWEPVYRPVRKAP